MRKGSRFEGIFSKKPFLQPLRVEMLSSVRFLLSAMISVAALSIGSRPSHAVAQETRAPLTFVVVIDISGSMEDRFPAPVQARLGDSTKLMDVKRQLSLLAEHLPQGTRVIVTAFDHESKGICDLRLGSPEARVELQKHFDSIKSRNGSTFLWRTLDKQLEQAAAIAKAEPENRVRVLCYSDGEDQEKAPGLDYRSIIKKFGGVLQDEVKVNFITLGFDLKSDVGKALRDAGVEITRAVSAEEIAPLMAGVAVSSESVRVGDELSLMDRSIGVGIAQRIADWGDKSPYEEGALLRHRYRVPGEYTIRYLVKTASGRTSQTSLLVRVTSPPPSPVRIRLSAAKVMVGELVRVEDITEGEATGRIWRVAMGDESTSPVLETRFERPGRHRVTLVRTDAYGREGEGGAEVDVELPMPPQAKFRVAAKPLRPGDSIALINESTPNAGSFVWKVGGKVVSNERHPSVTLDGYGSHVVTLSVEDAYGQTAMAEETITLERPAAPVAKFELADEVQPGESIVLVDGSTGEVTGMPRWIVDGQEIGSGRSVTHRIGEPGSVIVRLVVAGPGGTSMAEKRLTVAKHAAPKGGFTVGNPSPFVGDVIRITDTSTGPVDRAEFEVTGLPEKINAVFRKGQSDRSFDIRCVRGGEIKITQRVFGPGGEDALAKPLAIASRSIRPTADFESRLNAGEGMTRAEFVDRSQGTIERITFEAGDGSEARDYAIGEPIRHEYGVGTWTPRITAHGPAAEGLPSSTWVGAEIVVAKPVATWVKNLAWQAPVGLACGLVAFLVGNFVRQRRLRMHQMRLSGHLTVRPTDKPRDVKTFEFAGENCEETIELGMGSRLKLSTRDDGVLRYQAELVRDGQSVESADLDETVPIKLGEYLVSYSA